MFLIAPVLARAADTDEYAMRDRLREAIERARNEARGHWSTQQERFSGTARRRRCLPASTTGWPRTGTGNSLPNQRRGPQGSITSLSMSLPPC